MRFSGLGKVKLTVVLAVAVFFVLSSLWLVLNAKTDDSRIRSAGIGIFFAAAIPSVVVARRRLSQVEREETGLLDPHATVVLKRQRLNSFLRLLFSLGAVVAGLAFIRTSPPGSVDSMIAWAMLVVFSVMGLISLVLLFWRGYTITLSPEGIDYSVFKVGPIAWADIRSAELRPYLKQQVISLELFDSDKYFGRGYSMQKLNESIAKRFNLSPFMVSGEVAGSTSRKVQEAVTVRLAAFGLNHPSSLNEPSERSF